MRQERDEREGKRNTMQTGGWKGSERKRERRNESEGVCLCESFVFNLRVRKLPVKKSRVRVTFGQLPSKRPSEQSENCVLFLFHILCDFLITLLSLLNVILLENFLLYLKCFNYKLQFCVSVSGLKFFEFRKFKSVPMAMSAACSPTKVRWNGSAFGSTGSSDYSGNSLLSSPTREYPSRAFPLRSAYAASANDITGLVYRNSSLMLAETESDSSRCRIKKREFVDRFLLFSWESSFFSARACSEVTIV